MASHRPNRATGAHGSQKAGHVSSFGRLGRVARLVVALTVAMAVSGACAPGDVPAAPTDDAELVQGQAVWSANCVNCHGASGGGGVGTPLNDGRVVDRYPDVAEQRALIVDGVRAMPAFAGKLTDDEIDAVVRYTREIIAAQP